MKTSAFCPISNKKINEKVTRLNAGFVILLLIVFAFTQDIIPILFLGLDFLLRSTDFVNYSPIRAISLLIAKRIHLKPVFVNEGPKRFAARIGLFFIILISIAFLLHASIVTVVFTVILGICSFLESVLDFCIACEIYPYVYKAFYKDSFTVSI